MPGAAIQVDDELRPVLALIGLALDHPGKLTSAFAAHMLYSTQRRFETETDPDGVKWKALARRTTLKKVRGNRRRGENNILRVSGDLYRSLVAQSDDKSASVGSNRVYARVHQEGGDIRQYARSQKASLLKVKGKTRFVPHGKKGSELRNVTIGEHVINIPARPYLGFSESDRARLVEIGHEFLEGLYR
ncbi:MAG: phage virion morphogenesis protein [Agrobacterium cavarae]